MRVLKAKVAAFSRGGYEVVDGDIVPVVDVDAARTVETGTIREDLERDRENHGDDAGDRSASGEEE